MNLKSIAAVTLTLLATSVLAAPASERSCGAGSCSKKTTSADAAKQDAACSKKEDAACSKKDEAACSKKDEAACSKKDSSGK